MVAIVPPDAVEAALELLKARGERASVIGVVRDGQGDVVIE
jgi:hydrogenase maturation factor